MPVMRQSPTGEWADLKRYEQAIRSGQASAVMIIPRDLPEQLLREKEIDIPIKYNSVDETSQMTYLRLKEVLSRWRKGIVAGRLKRDQKTESYTDPIQVRAEDVATASEVGGSTWSRLFPFLLGHDVAHGCILPGNRLVRGRKRTGHDGDAAHQPREPGRDRPREIPDGDARQRDDRVIEPGEHGLDRHAARSPVRLTLGRSGPPRGRGDAGTADVSGRILDALAPDPACRVLQRTSACPWRSWREA